MAGTLTSGFVNSRLLTNSNNLRETLYTRNLYAPNTEYPLTNQNTVSRIVNSISGVVSAVTPFKSYNLKNTVYGRLAGDSTPLTEIGLVMLGKHFALNSMSYLAKQTFPIIKVSNLFDGNKDTKLFTKRIDLRITKKEDDTKFENFLDKIFYYYPSKDYPFTKNPSNADFIRNSGTGQLQFLYQAINQNIYKQNDDTLTKYGDIVEKPIQPQITLVSNKTFFSFNSAVAYPYMIKHPSEFAVDIANQQMIISYDRASTFTNTQEYAPDASFVVNNLGTQNKTEIFDAGIQDSQNEWIQNDTEFSKDNNRNKLVWGRDGVGIDASEKLSELRGDIDEEVNNLAPNAISGFKIRSGLLEYTRNLLNASEGQFVDITRKAFRTNDKLVGFQGSGLWKANDSKYAVDSGTAGKQGVRQHTILDQYDRFAKAIRFNGNKVYGGNPDSVIFNSVLPRIHPVLNDKGKPDPKNLMFSIENLAIGVISKGDYGIIDDEQGSPIPLSEVGPFNGRIMWFPPYNLEIVETATAKFEPTVMIGRNEPLYNYQNSERSATITFSLLVDYPEHLRNYLSTTGRNKDISEFFAFGGDLLETKVDELTIHNYELRIKEIQGEIEKEKGKTELVEPKFTEPTPIRISFPNDAPRVNDNLNTIFDTMYRGAYEVWLDTPSYMINDTTAFGINKFTYFISGITENNTLDPGIANAFSQYNAIGVNDQFGENLLNKQLREIFENEDLRRICSVYVYGGASKLYTELNPDDIEEGEAYNLALGKRRADATIILIKKRLEAMFGKSVADGIEVTYDRIGSSVGDREALDENATKVAIPEYNTKLERFALISIKRNNKSIEKKEVRLTPDAERVIREKQWEIELIYTKINELRSKTNDNVFKERTGAQTNEGDGAILGGFKSVSGNYYYPVFHTQTPEDFHKRLTFLHQCTRQGAAKRYSDIDGNGKLRARNSVFGRQPICVLRIGDFFYTKIIIESLNIDYNDTTWDMNPEGFGMQPMIANITLNIKIMGGQSLKGPIDALQNAVSFNYYANSTFSKTGIYQLPTDVAEKQSAFMEGVLSSKIEQLTKEDKIKNPDRYKES